MVDLENFKINGYVCGLIDTADVIEGKEQEFIDVCTELWDYFFCEDGFETKMFAEDDYIRLCDIGNYAYAMNNSNLLHDMDDLDSYCEKNGIGITDFLERSKNFDCYENYFIEARQFFSGDRLRCFGIDYTDILRRIIEDPIPFCKYNHNDDIEDEIICDIANKMSRCVKPDFYWTENEKE